MLIRTLALLWMAPLAAQTTWIVDDTPGPGVDFSSITAALAVAGPFDVVDVRPGDYGAFQLTRSTRIIGSQGARVSGTSSVLGLPAGSWTFIADLTLERLHASLVQGTLVLDELTLTGDARALEVLHCLDVRAHGVTATVRAEGVWSAPKVRVLASRVQLVDCVVEANPPEALGTLGQHSDNGQHGLSVESGSFLYLDRCTVIGGAGEDNHSLFGTGFAGQGGHACVGTGSSDVTCVRSFLRGGNGGYASTGSYGQDGQGGHGLYALDGEQRAWDTEFIGGQRGGAYAHAAGVNLGFGRVLDTTHEFPSLVTLGTPQASSPVTIELHTEVGASARLLAGRLPVQVPVAGALNPRLVDLGRDASLGFVPPSGHITVPLMLGPWPRGTVLFLQGVRTAAGAVELTNAAALIVR